MKLRHGLLCIAGLLAGCGPSTLAVGPGKEATLPSEAIAEAGYGDTILIQPGVYTDCARIRASHVTIEGAGPGVVLTDKTCGGKAILVIDGDDVTIKNLTLQRAKVRDHNGAGIRAQGGSLTVDNVRFLNNEEGILSTSNPNATIRIINSYFEGNGKCEGACAHGIYINHVAELDVENSHFVNQHIGHHVKSRALKTVLRGNTIEDGPDGTASYEVDIPSGGSLIMEGNTLQKGPKADNWVDAVIVGEEKHGVQPTGEIIVRNNTFTNDNPHRTIFVDNRTQTPALLVGNKLNGDVEVLKGPGEVR